MLQIPAWPLAWPRAASRSAELILAAPSAAGRRGVVSESRRRRRWRPDASQRLTIKAASRAAGPPRRRPAVLQSRRPAVAERRQISAGRRRQLSNGRQGCSAVRLAARRRGLGALPPPPPTPLAGRIQLDDINTRLERRQLSGPSSDGRSRLAANCLTRSRPLSFALVYVWQSVRQTHTRGAHMAAAQLGAPSSPPQSPPPPPSVSVGARERHAEFSNQKRADGILLNPRGAQK
jgi:hypothetical protein